MPKQYNAHVKAYKKQNALNQKQKSEVKTLIAKRQELKYYNYYNSGSTSTLGIADIAPIPQGDGDSTRDGDRLQWCGSIDLRLNIVNSTGATGDMYNTVRFIIFQWHPNTVPIVSEILLPGPSSGADVYSQYTHDYRQQYKILYDKTIRTVGNGLSSVQPYAPNVAQFIHKKISLKNASKYAQFTGATTTGTNKLYYLMGSDSSVTDHPTYHVTMKTVYRDS